MTNRTTSIMSEVKDGCECSDKQERKAEVRRVLFGAWYPSESERDYALETFTKSLLSISEIEAIVAPLKTINSSTKDRKARIFGVNDKAMPGGIA